MNTISVKKSIREFLSGFVDVSDVEDSDNLFEMGMLNSLFAMQLVLFVEKEFGFQVSNDNLSIENFKSIDAMANMVVS